MENEFTHVMSRFGDSEYVRANGSDIKTVGQLKAVLEEVPGDYQVTMIKGIERSSSLQIVNINHKNKKITLVGKE